MQNLGVVASNLAELWLFSVFIIIIIIIVIIITNMIIIVIIILSVLFRFITMPNLEVVASNWPSYGHFGVSSSLSSLSSCRYHLDLLPCKIWRLYLQNWPSYGNCHCHYPVGLIYIYYHAKSPGCSFKIGRVVAI